MKYKHIAIMLFTALLLYGCTNTSKLKEEKELEKIKNNPDLRTAIFAGGCFWCMEAGFEAQDGVIEVVSGYTAGMTDNPTYEEVSTGNTGHYEAVQVYYDPKKISYEKLLESFWIQIDPTDPEGQFSDKGSQYMTAIFYSTDDEKNMAENSKRIIAEKFDKPIATRILPAERFYEAEEYHQDYYKKEQSKYSIYKKLSGRESNIKENEKRLANTVMKTEKEDYSDEIAQLTPLKYKVTQEEGTEPAFNNEYWDNKEEGIYVDVVSGEPLFSSTDKFDSGTGWPSFTKPIDPAYIVEKTDYKIGVPRTEVRSKLSDSHLGHVFSDGPEPTGVRYCMNSAALRFVPKEQLEEEGYEEYRYLFSGQTETRDFQNTQVYDDENVLAGSQTQYRLFDEEAYEQALQEDKTILLYFYANWCPICIEEEKITRAAFEDVKNPEVIGFRVNYKDSETNDYEEELAKKYGITYQHTKVILHNGKRVLKAPDSWTKERYIQELGKITGEVN